jgi:hypothetical protein
MTGIAEFTCRTSLCCSVWAVAPVFQRVLVSTSAKSPADPHGGRQVTDKRRLAKPVLNQGRSPLSRASVAVEAGRFISMITSLSRAPP